ncbi:MAG: hypothetical protein WBD31_28075 [Rubripirellula sp.]
MNQSGSRYANEEEVGYFVSGAARGVEDAAAHYESLGVNLRGLEAKIIKLVVHEVDSTERAFWTAAKKCDGRLFGERPKVTPQGVQT